MHRRVRPRAIRVRRKHIRRLLTEVRRRRVYQAAVGSCAVRRWPCAVRRRPCAVHRRGTGVGPEQQLLVRIVGGRLPKGRTPSRSPLADKLEVVAIHPIRPADAQYGRPRECCTPTHSRGCTPTHTGACERSCRHARRNTRVRAHTPARTNSRNTTRACTCDTCMGAPTQGMHTTHSGARATAAPAATSSVLDASSSTKSRQAASRWPSSGRITCCNAHAACGAALWCFGATRAARATWMVLWRSICTM